MTKEILAKAIGEIDLKFIDNAVKTDKKSNIRLFRAEYAVVAAVFVLVIGVSIFSLGRMPENFAFKTDGYLSNGGFVGGVEEGAPQSVNGEHKGILTPAEVTGNGYTDEQLKNYVEENKNTVIQTVIAEYGGITGELRIYTKGYCHAAAGENNTVNRDYVTLPITLDGKIIASMEIYSVDGVISSSVNIGGDTWSIRNKLFEENPQGDIVFAWFGGIYETAITEDNKIYSLIPEGNNLLKGDENWYSILKTDYNTFSAEDFNNPDNYISAVNNSNEP